MEPLGDRLRSGEVLLLDGAMGTMLLERALGPGECPELLNLSRPEVIEEICGAYLDAGADILEANTFGASPMKLAQYDLQDRTEEINEAAVDLVRKVAGGRAYVAGCCGPGGKLLKPYGDAEPDDLLAGFHRQMECLMAAGVDAICIETMIDLGEARLALQAAKDVSATVPVLATMTFDATPRGFFTVMGVSVEQAAHGLRDAGADAVGSNCGNGLDGMIAIAARFREHTDMPLIIQSNAGLPETRDGQVVYNETPEFFAERVHDLLRVGVSLIGGCCGTTPDHTKALRAAINAASR